MGIGGEKKRDGPFSFSARPRLTSFPGWRLAVKRVIEEQITGSQAGSNVNDSTGLASVNAGGSQPQAIEYTPAGGLRASPSTGEFPNSTKRGSGVPLGAATALGHGRSASGFARPMASTAAGGGHSRHVSAASGRAPFAASAPLTVDSGKANGSSSRRELSALITPSPTASSFQARQASSSLETPRSGRNRQDEFEALIKSGQTMKVSLTPSRLKGFDVSCRWGDEKIGTHSNMEGALHRPRRVARRRLLPKMSFPGRHPSPLLSVAKQVPAHNLYACSQSRHRWLSQTTKRKSSWRLMRATRRPIPSVKNRSKTCSRRIHHGRVRSIPPGTTSVGRVRVAWLMSRPQSPATRPQGRRQATWPTS